MKIPPHPSAVATSFREICRMRLSRSDMVTGVKAGMFFENQVCGHRRYWPRVPPPNGGGVNARVIGPLGGSPGHRGAGFPMN